MMQYTDWKMCSDTSKKCKPINRSWLIWTQDEHTYMKGGKDMVKK
jgi:hypothetical protein